MNILKFLFVSLFLIPAASQACGGSSYSWLDIRVLADGEVVRQINENPELPTFEAIRDGYLLRNVGEKVTLVAGMQIKGQKKFVTVELLEQVSDTYLAEGKMKKGVFASLFKVTKNAIAASSTGATSNEGEFVMVTNNYVGNGSYTRGCGGVETSTDRAKLKMPVKP